MSNQASLGNISESSRNEAENERKHITGFGSFPSEWEKESLLNAAEIRDNERIPINSEERGKKKPGNIPYYGANGKVDEINEYIFDGDFVLLAEDGGHFEEYQDRPVAYKISGKAWVNNHAHILEADDPLITDWLFYSLEHRNLVPYINGSTRSKLTKTMLKKVKVPLPPKPEQHKVASVLCNVDRAIQKTEEIIEQTRRAKKGLMQNLFTEGYYDHKEFEKHPTLGKYPTNWEVKQIEEIGKVNSDSFSLEDYNEDTFGYITLSNVSEGQILQIEETPANNAPSRAKRKVKSGDVLIGTVRPKQKSHAQVPKEHDGKVCSTGFAVIRLESMNPDYLSQEIFTHRFFSQMEAYVAGSGYPAVKNSDVKKIRVASPPKDEQEKIAETLQNYDNELEKLQEEKEQLQRIKKGLRQDLLTGKVRTKDKDIEILDEVLEVEKS